MNTQPQEAVNIAQSAVTTGTQTVVERGFDKASMGIIVGGFTLVIATVFLNFLYQMYRQSKVDKDIKEERLKAQERADKMTNQLLKEFKETACTMTSFASEIMELRKDINRTFEDNRIYTKQSLEILLNMAENVSDRNFMSDGDFRDAMLDRISCITLETTNYIYDIIDNNNIKENYKNILYDITTFSESIVSDSKNKILQKHYFDNIKDGCIANAEHLKEEITRDVFETFKNFYDKEEIIDKDYVDMKRRTKDICKKYKTLAINNVQDAITKQRTKYLGGA